MHRHLHVLHSQTTKHAYTPTHVRGFNRQARENAPAILRVRRLAAARSQETLAVSLLQTEGEDGDGGRLELRAQFLMTFGTLARFKVGWLAGWIDRTAQVFGVQSVAMYVCVVAIYVCVCF